MRSPDEEPATACGCALTGTPAGSGVPPASCAPKLALSLEEEAILRRMRALKMQARALKARLEPSGTAPVGDQAKDLQRQLDQIRRRFNAERDELRRANRNKLIRLGHEP